MDEVIFFFGIPIVMFTYLAFNSCMENNLKKVCIEAGRNINCYEEKVEK